MMTPALKTTFDFLKTHPRLRKLTTVSSTPHVFVPEGLENQVPDDKQGWYFGTLQGKPVSAYPCRPSLNKLVLLGHARYEDKANTIIVFVDKEAEDAQKAYEARIGRAVIKAMEKGDYLVVSGYKTLSKETLNPRVLIETVDDLLKQMEDDDQ